MPQVHYQYTRTPKQRAMRDDFERQVQYDYFFTCLTKQWRERYSAVGII